MALTSVKMAELAPMPSASVSSTVRVNPGAFATGETHNPNPVEELSCQTSIVPPKYRTRANPNLFKAKNYVQIRTFSRQL